MSSRPSPLCPQCSESWAESPKCGPLTRHSRSPVGPVTFPSRSCSGRKNWWEKTLSPGGQLPGVWWLCGPGREERGEPSRGHLSSEQPPGPGGQLPPRPHGVGTSLTCRRGQLPIAWLRSQKVLLEVVAGGGQWLEETRSEWRRDPPLQRQALSHPQERSGGPQARLLGTASPSEGLALSKGSGQDLGQGPFFPLR